MQRGAANTSRDKMDKDEKKGRETSSLNKSNIVKPAAVLFGIIGLAFLWSTVFLKLEWGV